MIGLFPRFLDDFCFLAVGICSLRLFNRLKLVAIPVGNSELPVSNSDE
jgi:hypothetical protein